VSKKKRRRVAPAPPQAGRGQPPPAASRRSLALPVAVGAAALVAIAVAVVVLAVRGSSGQPTPAARSSRAAASSAANLGTVPPLRPGTGQTVDGIACERQEQVVYHIHAHLAIFANGQARTVPLGIGIPGAQTQPDQNGQPFAVSGSCFYWLHSHATDGILHVESPSQRTYTLGSWFDIWGQPLSASQVGADVGTVTAYVNGRPYTGDPRSIPLQEHAVIQLDVGTDVAPRPYTFPGNL
jgi:hypothetical protein